MLDKNQELSLTLSLNFTANLHSNSPQGLQTTRVCSKKEGWKSYLDERERNRVCSPHSTITSLQSGKRSTGESNTSNNSDEEDGDGSRKKLRLSKDQAAVLEESFKEHNTLNPKEKHALARSLNLQPRQVEVWFQNRRARTKLKQTEVDLELLKRCFNNLSEENRRMQKEVEELRALKLSSQFYMNMTPPTTLTMCPSCKRVTSSRDTRS